MRNAILKITLLSDMCVSDGSVFNVVVDTEVCKDEYGFPYIPARRIKGCLRECALELQEWGDRINPDQLFGLGGNQRGKVRIGDAVLEEAGEQREFLRGQKNGSEATREMFHPVNILKHYTYNRTQTALDPETGSAGDTSLRTMRVVNKGLVFQAPVQVEEDQYDDLEKLCHFLRHMGIARTRGLGEVRAELIPNEVAPDQPAKEISLENGLDLLISLQEPVICKSIHQGEAETLDYIEGSKIFGLILEQTRAKDRAEGTRNADVLLSMEDEPLLCSNAYISCNQIRCTEAPAALYAVKNQETELRDALYDPDNSKRMNERGENGEPLQLNPVHHMYIYEDASGNVHRYSVQVEERYHHSRPEDKSIGRAVENDGDVPGFYSMSSICAGQTFQAHLSGPMNKLQIAKAALAEAKECYLGFARSSEYGRVQVSLIPGSKQVMHSEACSRLAVALVSPTIVYNRKGTYTRDTEDLREEMLAALGLKDDDVLLDEVKAFTRFTQVGGWNTTWRKRKPTVDAFDAGTVLLLPLKHPVQQLPLSARIGERIMEGYGEIRVIPMMDGADHYKKKLIRDGQEAEKAACVNVAENEFAMAIAMDCFRDRISHIAMEKANDIFKNSSADWKATIANLTLMCNEAIDHRGSVIALNMTPMEEVRRAVTLRYRKVDEDGQEKQRTEKKQKKYDIAQKILDAVPPMPALIREFQDQYGLQGFSCDEEGMKMVCLKALLTQGKYKLHHQPKNSGKGAENV